jgi:hypothetical protein
MKVNTIQIRGFDGKKIAENFQLKFSTASPKLFEI